MNTITRSYAARCRDCRYVRHFGYAHITAECKAIKHALTKGHCVDVTVIDLTTLTTSLHQTYGKQGQESEPLW